ncbi:glycosyltransferase [Castellaniella sp.]|uniref:glycosyltransferase n=1 Tax=Castellaniella sp. TaxID=1955812 RepID=UPI003C7435A7
MNDGGSVPWVAYVGPFLFPWGEAGSRRVYGVTRSLVAAGYQVIVAGGDQTPSIETQLEEYISIHQCSYLGLQERPSSRMSSFLRVKQVLWDWGKRTVRWLDAQKTPPKYVILYGGNIQFAWRLLDWCHKRDVKLIGDVVEWYDPRHMVGGVLGPINIGDKLAFHRVYPRFDGIIAISSLLENHFLAKGCKVIRVPPTIDISKFKIEKPLKRDSGQIELVYTGTPGKKDLLSSIMAGVLQANARCHENNKFVLNVLGPSAEQVRGMLDTEQLPSCIRALGRVPQVDVAQHVQRADFSVLLRPPSRSSKAGFPTKFVESFANGTPVVCNLTSDIGEYLQDGQNGVICKDCSSGSFSASLQYIASMPPSERELMKKKARYCAEAEFSFEKFTGKIAEFLHSL